ncbi:MULTISPECIES: HAD family hydrolase [unclassified Flavobacterium]|uniref:HAD family hydrolase n=1 Tax=unclassified Flavobacterium TaxID=196869 RepID=UPI00057F4DD2|nr:MULTISPECIES: HAD family hydrolase [unclassified Flavobacterium]KIC03936.1 phosphoglycolate phosphatase [Flavobacterium sp. JRM]MEA9413407.1 HAD family hydrolase [Flavobacterium sp. PL02]OUL60337.1 phosphoglycolate phosphatase [Flavobacterium sp. AJR]
MKINYENHSHLSFDLWLTLIKSNPEFKSKRNLLFKDFFDVDATIEKVNDVVRYYDVLCNNINERTGLNIDTYEIYYLILSALNVNINDIDTTKLKSFYNETELLFLKYKPELLYANIPQLFKEITQQDKTINLLSNTAFIKGNTLRKILSHYELESYFKFQIYSDEVGLSKPNNEIFQLVFNQANEIKPITKKEILHIGDNIIADYNGAINFGFDAHLLKL